MVSARPLTTLATCCLSKLVNFHRLGAHPMEAFGVLRGDGASTGSLRETQMSANFII